jgi:hypothetical protein
LHKHLEHFIALRYVFTYPGIISRAELVPSHGRLGEKELVYTVKDLINSWSLSYCRRRRLLHNKAYYMQQKYAC